MTKGTPLASVPTFFYALLFALLPGLAVALWILPPRLGFAARFGAALALSPAVGGLALTPFLLHGGAPLHRAALGLFVASALATAAALGTRRAPAGDGADSAPAAATGSARVTAWVAVLAVASTAAFPLCAEWWRVYSDAWTHAGIARAIALQGVPPLDPGFAGVRLQYAWIYHVFVAAARELTGVDAYAFMSLLGAMALGGVVLSAGAALRGRPRAVVAWTLALLLLGMNASLPLFLPLQLVRAFTGTVRGWAELHRLFALTPLDTERTGVFLRSLGGEDFFLGKFMVATPFALALACATAWWAAFRRYLADGGGAELAAAVALTLAAGLMHPVVGLDLGAVAGGVVLASFFGGRNAAGATGATAAARARRWGVAVLVGLVPVVLYTATIVGGKGGTHRELPLDLTPFKVLGYVSCLGLGLGFAAAPLVRAWRGRDDERAWAVALVTGIVVALVVRLPGPSAFFTVDKFGYLVWIPLALTAGPALAAYLATRSALVRVAFALVFFLPVTGLEFASRLADAHVRVVLPWNAPVYTWLRAHTPKDAVLLTPAGDWETAQFAERDQYYSLGHPTVQLGYPAAEIAARSRLVDRLFTTGRLDADDRARLGALHHPVYIVWTDFREPRWLTTPGAIARNGAMLGPRPAFDDANPLVFAADGQEVRAVTPPATDSTKTRR